MVTISLCMIVKNEEAVLERCLNSVSDLVDEIVKMCIRDRLFRPSLGMEGIRLSFL